MDHEGRLQVWLLVAAAFTVSSSPLDGLWQPSRLPNVYQTQGDGDPSVPSGLYDTPVVPPPVPSGLYDIPLETRPASSGLFQTPSDPSETLESSSDPFQIISEPSDVFETPSAPSDVVETPSNQDETPLESDPGLREAAQNLEPDVAKPMEGMPYAFQFGVDDPGTGNAFSHVENSDGRTTQGEYRVLLPDGRTQVVKFFDSGEGFTVSVTYEQ